jgi:hypothetical protein
VYDGFFSDYLWSEIWNFAYILLPIQLAYGTFAYLTLTYAAKWAFAPKELSEALKRLKMPAIYSGMVSTVAFLTMVAGIASADTGHPTLAKVIFVICVLPFGIVALIGTTIFCSCYCLALFLHMLRYPILGRTETFFWIATHRKGVWALLVLALTIVFGIAKLFVSCSAEELAMELGQRPYGFAERA